MRRYLVIANAHAGSVEREALDAAAGVLSAAGPTEVRIPTDTARVVVNAAHAGLGAEAAAAAADHKPRLGPLAYPLGALLAGVKEKGWALRVSVDGTPYSTGERLLMVGVANGPTIGGGTPLCPMARADDGRLDVVTVAAVGPAARVGFAAALRAGTHLDRDDVHHLRGTRVRVSGEPVRHNVDGELDGEVTDRGYLVLPGAWSLLVPEAP